MTLFELRGWFRLAWRFILYFAYRLGVGKCPTFLDLYPQGVYIFDRIMHWPSRLRVEEARFCPKTGPVVFAGNHQKKDDPFIMYRAIHRTTEGAYSVRFMMRDDFFKGIDAAKSRFIDVDELARMAGALLISRQNVQLSQMKPFVTLLRERQGFIMYPGRSRSRSGVFMEYREGIEEPGGVSFFIAQAQRGRPDINVPAIPFTRTYNPATKKTAVTFGQAQYLPHDADRAMQRDLDFRLVEAMGDLLELNVSHVCAGILYIRCLHGHVDGIRVSALEGAIRSALDVCVERRIDPAARERLSQELSATLAYFETLGALNRNTDTVYPNATSILACPEYDTDFMEKNPVKHLVNQLLHLPDAIAAIESAAFDTF